MSEDFITVKQRKLERIRAFIKSDLGFTESKLNFNFLNNDLKKKYGLSESDNISSHGYDEYAQEIINENERGMILDCGCGLRNDYLENIVNFEIVPYESTDVVGLGESLPFIDNCFDAVLSLNVLEHVKNPFQCAAEISRVLKPGGRLYCVAAFLQPVHAFPDHYFNMTKEGMKLLFEKHLKIDEQKIIHSGLPIFSLTWILQQWVLALPEKARKSFLSKRISDFMESPINYMIEDYVNELPNETNEELASTTAIFATKT